MGACLSREEPSKKNHLIVDVQQIIAEDAWEEFVVTSPLRCRWFRPPKRSDYTVEVPMNYYHFEEVEQKFWSLNRRPSFKGNDAQSTLAASSDADTPDKVGLNTNFRNDTDQEQTYTFRFQKTRTAAVEVTYQKGFSIGGSANFTLGLPKVLPGGELSAEVNMNYEVTNSTGQKFEETVTTEATSEIKVSQKSNCVAKIVMEERRLLAEYMLRVTMSMPEKQAVVFIKNKQGRTVFLKVITNISMLFDSSYHLKDDNGKVREDAVQFMVHGIVDGTQLATHTIHLKGRKIGPKLVKGSGAGSSVQNSKTSGTEKTGLTNISDVDFSDS